MIQGNGQAQKFCQKTNSFRRPVGLGASISQTSAKHNYSIIGGDKVSELFTCGEVAQRYKVEVITVWDWIRKGKLPAMKLGKEYRISAEDLKAFEDAHRRPCK